MKPHELFSVARLFRPHGLKGDIKAEPLSHDFNRHKKLDQVYLCLGDGSLLQAQVLQSKAAGEYWMLRFAGYENPETASALNGALVQLPLSERIPPPPGEYYPSDLEGLTVIDDEGNPCGKVVGMLELPSVNSLELRIRGIDILAPWIDDCVGSIDLQARTVVVHMDFLRELCPQLDK